MFQYTSISNVLLKGDDELYMYFSFSFSLFSVALICGVLLYVIDLTSEGTLNLSAWARHRIEKEKEEKEKIALDKYVYNYMYTYTIMNSN